MAVQPIIATVSRPDATDAARPIPLWRNRNYVLLWAGQAQSLIGTQVSQVAFLLLVLALTRSPQQAGLVAAFGIIPPMLLSLLAGALVDRWDRRRVMIACDMTRTLNMASIPLLLWLGHLSIAQLCLATLVEGTCSTFFVTAHSACLKCLVPKEQLPEAVARNETMWGISTLAGPSLGGTLFQALGRSAPFLVDAASYAISVLSLMFIRIPPAPSREVANSTATDESGAGSLRQQVRELGREIRDGLAWTQSHSLVRRIIVLTAGIYLVGAGANLTVIVLAREHHASHAAIGLTLAMAGIGSTVGSLVVVPLQHRLTSGRLMATMLGLQALVWGLLALVPSPWMLGTLLALEDGFFTVYLVTQSSLRLQLVPDELQGRVASVARLLGYGAMAGGVAVTGTLLQSLGVRGAVFVSSACCLALAIHAVPITRPRFMHLLATQQRIA